jgi:hypothetical protein
MSAWLTLYAGGTKSTHGRGDAEVKKMINAGLPTGRFALLRDADNLAGDGQVVVEVGPENGAILRRCTPAIEVSWCDRTFRVRSRPYPSLSPTEDDRRATLWEAEYGLMYALNLAGYTSPDLVTGKRGELVLPPPTGDDCGVTREVTGRWAFLPLEQVRANKRMLAREHREALRAAAACASSAVSPPPWGWRHPESVPRNVAEHRPFNPEAWGNVCDREVLAVARFNPSVFQRMLEALSARGPAWAS